MGTVTLDIDEVIHRDPEIRGGQPCFKGTRVPIETLFDHVKEDLETGLAEFLDGFPRVTRDQALTVLHYRREDLDL